MHNGRHRGPASRTAHRGAWLSGAGRRVGGGGWGGGGGGGGAWGGGAAGSGLAEYSHRPAQRESWWNPLTRGVAIAQLSYSHKASPEPLLGETIGDNLRRIAAAHPGREALVDLPTGRRWTYAQLDADTDTLARGLINQGIEAGDRVGIWSPNCAEWVLLQYATAKAGVVLVNINPAYRSHELAYVLRQSGVRVLVSAESFKTSNYRAMIEEVSSDADRLESVVYLGSPEWDALTAVQ